MLKKLTQGGVFVLLLIFSLVAYQLFCFQFRPIVVAPKGIEAKLEPGSGVRSFLATLSDTQGYKNLPLFWFEGIIRLKGDATKLKAGQYNFEQGLTPSALLAQVVRGDVSEDAFTLIEGWTTVDVLNNLKEQEVLKQTLSDTAPKELMAKLGQPDTPFEGMFFPDTYYFPKGTTDVSFLQRAMKTLHKHLFSEWKTRSANIAVKTPYEALILASIIEKESVAAEERAIISGVLHSRLDKNMRLQVDPTVLYGLGKSHKEGLTKADLAKDSPYNTYIYKGLPPTPIALPSLDSIKAAVNPIDHDYLYFVAKGDGTHHFSATLKEHNQAVKKYLKNKK